MDITRVSMGICPVTPWGYPDPVGGPPDPVGVPCDPQVAPHRVQTPRKCGQGSIVSSGGFKDVCANRPVADTEGRASAGRSIQMCRYEWVRP